MTCSSSSSSGGGYNWLAIKPFQNNANLCATMNLATALRCWSSSTGSTSAPVHLPASQPGEPRQLACARVRVDSVSELGLTNRVAQKARQKVRFVLFARRNSSHLSRSLIGGSETLRFWVAKLLANHGGNLPISRRPQELPISSRISTRALDGGHLLSRLLFGVNSRKQSSSRLLDDFTFSD